MVKVAFSGKAIYYIKYIIIKCVGITRSLNNSIDSTCQVVVAKTFRESVLCGTCTGSNLFKSYPQVYG